MANPFQFLQKHNQIHMNSVAGTGTCLTPLIAACRYGHIDRVNLLLSMGVNFDQSVTTGTYANALCAAIDGQCMRAIRQLLRRDLSHPKDDAIDIWRKNYLEASTPEYSASISKKRQALLFWLILPILQHRHEEELRGGDTSATAFNRLEGRRDEPDDFLWDGCGDSDDKFESDDNGYDTTNHDKGDLVKPDQEQEEVQDHHRTGNDSGVWKESNSLTLHTAGHGEEGVTGPSDEEVLKNINDLISWLHQDCRQKSQVVQHNLAETFGFSLSELNDSIELVRNALLKGFQNVVHLTHE
ncbi:uncharacterized protein B0J16DRAFT_372861 [Fusarium flagelliforme]|uniref:uncharacterized protein n=1 Tax=Fusarium flagelliforme TaxID=2675880 RepID=UPI001E8D76CB|nr:uncharacterized protein B0J16DRAFT_372861 [Fusarium flagelliforme]KAH7186184.1 hypothetical protein B0J16DRAFT_372861 [Fusarium flagelliforme]